MSHVFVSHAAPDKLPHIKPLVHALAIEGVCLWLDRPGIGDSHFNFDQAFIDRFGIQGLQSGVDYGEGIRAALRRCGAVLVCLSRSAIDHGRLVLQQEVTIAWYDEKIVSCIVDDLAFTDIPADTGMPIVVRTQSERVDTAGLQQCLDWMAANGSEGFDALPHALRPFWQPVRKIRNDLDAAMARGRLGRAQSPASERTATLQALLNDMPLRPPLSLLERLYRLSLPDVSRRLVSPGLPALLRDLDDSRPRAAQLPSPLVEFAERLARAFAHPALGQWVDAQTAADPFALGELRRRLDEEQREAVRTRATLFVDVDPEVNRRIRWWVHSADPACCTQEEIAVLDGPVEAAVAQCLAAGLASAEASFGQKASLSVALLLPSNLLAAGLERMQMQFADDEDLGPTLAALHRRYPVTLHWRKRSGARRKPDRDMSDGTGKSNSSPSINAWNRVLDTLDKRIAANAGACVHWIDSEAADGIDQSVSGAAARLCNPDGDAVCIGLGPLLTGHDARLQGDLKVCLAEGIPCFFWFSPPAGRDQRVAVASEFARHTPCDAPLQVGLLRKTSGAASPFASLSLVWDLPQLMPLPSHLTDSTGPAGQ